MDKNNQSETDNIKREEDKVDNPDKENVEDHTNRNMIIVLGLIFLIMIAVFSIRFFSSEDSIPTIDELHDLNIEGKEGENNYLYNGFSFVFANGLWYTQIQGGNRLYNIPLHYGPRDLEDVEIIGDLSSFAGIKETYITFDPTEENLGYVALANGELSTDLVKIFNTQLTATCTVNDTPACEGVPVITCNNTDESVIFLRQSDEASVELIDNCVIISGRDEGLVKATNRFLYHLFSIMP